MLILSCRNNARYISYCRYYKGGNNDPYEVVDQNKSMLWFYESCWVRMKQDGQNVEDYLAEYIAVGLKPFMEGDGIPIDLKAVLFNRHAKTAYSLMDAVEPFKKFYLKYYPYK